MRSRKVLVRRAAFVTLTAPGKRAHGVGGWQCPCTPPEGTDLAAWNPTAGARFNRFVRDLRREYGDDLQYFKAAEVQTRGALHFHLLIRRVTKTGQPGGPLLLSEAVIRALALKHGFGHEVDVQELAPGHASYVAKYVGKSADARRSLPWNGMRWQGGKYYSVDMGTGELILHEKPRKQVPSYTPTFRTWSMSRKYGDPMSVVKLAQKHYMLVMDRLPHWGDGGAVPHPGWAAVAPDAVEFRRDGPLCDTSPALGP
jgi:hypothetical protein